METSVEQMKEFSYQFAAPGPEGADVLNVSVKIDTSWSFQDMEEARIERSQQPEIQLGHQDFQVLRQRVKDLERSLQDNVSSFTESEAALRNR